jgi:hypothetical protein
LNTNSPPCPPLYFVKRGVEDDIFIMFPLFAEQRGGIKGGEFMKLNINKHNI